MQAVAIREIAGFFALFAPLPHCAVALPNSISFLLQLRLRWAKNCRNGAEK
jgi:hypothetical protein